MKKTLTSFVSGFAILGGVLFFQWGQFNSAHRVSPREPAATQTPTIGTQVRSWITQNLFTPKSHHGLRTFKEFLQNEALQIPKSIQNTLLDQTRGVTLTPTTWKFQFQKEFSLKGLFCLQNKHTVSFELSLPATLVIDGVHVTEGGTVYWPLENLRKSGARWVSYRDDRFKSWTDNPGKQGQFIEWILQTLWNPQLPLGASYLEWSAEGLKLVLPTSLPLRRFGIETIGQSNGDAAFQLLRYTPSHIGAIPGNFREGPCIQ